MVITSATRLPETAKPWSAGQTKPILHVGLGDGWSDYPGRQMLLHSLAKYTPVIFVRWRQKHENRFRRPVAKRLGHNTYEVSSAFSFRNSRLRRLGTTVGWFDGRWLMDALYKIGVEEFVYWVSNPDPRMLWGMPTNRLVYDCVDPCFIPERQTDFDRGEFSVARRAKVVFCTARTLVERLRPVNRNCYLLPNGCSTDVLEGSQQGLTAVPEKLRSRSRPLIGYMGTMDWRFDVDAVSYAALAANVYICTSGSGKRRPKTTAGNARVT